MYKATVLCSRSLIDNVPGLSFEAVAVGRLVETSHSSGRGFSSLLFEYSDPAVVASSVSFWDIAIQVAADRFVVT